MTGERWRVDIGNLTFEVDGDDLARLTSPWGTVLGAEVVRDADTRRSKGYGWVGMSCESEAYAAAEGLNGREFRGRRLTAHFRTPPPVHSERQYGPARFRVDWAPSGSAPGGPEERFGRTELQHLCREFGRVMLVEVDEHGSPGQGQGCGCVEMDSAAAAQAAIAGLDQREYGSYRFTARPLKPWEDLRIPGWHLHGKEAARSGDREGSPPELRFSRINDFDPRKAEPGKLTGRFDARPIEARGPDPQPAPVGPVTILRDEEAQGPTGGTDDEDGREKSLCEKDQRKP